MEVIIKRKEKNMANENENDGKLRVVAYARVSSEEERQQGSFESQKKYYYEKITSNPDWTFKGIYGDEGISGTSSENRTGFISMIREARNRKFDLILTKSISRFARNTVDTLKFIRFLRGKGISIYFEEENINTSAIQGEMLITILSSLAQQESENTSSHVTAGIEMSLKNGTRTDFHKCYGYDYSKETKELTINKNAQNVKLIFDLYLKTENINEIRRELFKRKIKSPGGKEFWEPIVIMKVLTNEKYIGNSIFGESYVSDPLTHRLKKNYGERNIYKYIDHHEPIISKEIFDEVNKKIKKNKEGKIKQELKNRDYSILEWKGICGFCGCSLGVKNSSVHAMPSHQCLNSLRKLQRYLCPNSAPIKDREIENAFIKGIKKIRNKINLNTLSEEIEEKLTYVRGIILNAKLDKFNYEIYDKLVNLVIIGGYNSDGTPDPYTLRFILREDIMFDNKRKNRRRFHNKTLEILSFENHVNICYGRYNSDRVFYKAKIESIKVIFEVQNDDNLIWKL